jgi:hypothetical protein
VNSKDWILLVTIALVNWLINDLFSDTRGKVRELEDRVRKLEDKK